MTVTTVDLDDTLILTQRHYDEAIENFARHMEETHGFEPDYVADTLESIDRENFSQFGLSKERFPTSFADTVEELLENPSKEQKENAKEFGREVFKTEEGYAEEGFRDGAERMLKHLERYSHEMHLLTSGDSEVQNRKITALNLEERFDDIHIVESNGKLRVLEELSAKYSNREVVHIGNSESSDVKPALEAGVKVVYLPYKQWRNVGDIDCESNPDVNVFESISEYLDTLSNYKSIQGLKVTA